MVFLALGNGNSWATVSFEGALQLDMLETSGSDGDWDVAIAESIVCGCAVVD